MHTLESSHIEKPNTRLNLAGIENGRIRMVAPHLFELAKKIVEAGQHYDLIVSDDASARIVSLFIKKVLDGINNKKGSPLASIRFVASGRHSNRQVFDEIEKIIKKVPSSRTLVVTEHIATGDSMRKLMRILNKVGVPYDIATVSAETEGIDVIDEEINEFTENKPNFFMATVGDIGVDAFYGFRAKALSGVEKDGSGPYPNKIITSDTNSETKIAQQNIINSARADIDKLSEETLRVLKVK